MQSLQPVQITGKISKITGGIIQAKLKSFSIGDICHIKDPITAEIRLAEVIGIEDEQALLSLYGSPIGINNKCEVINTFSQGGVIVGEQILGRVLDPFGEALDKGAPIDGKNRRPFQATPPDPLSRLPIDTIMATGIKTLDGLLTCGYGQRLGIFGSAGTGKSTLLLQLIKYSDVDVVILGLVGERGREVREFIEALEDESGNRRTCVIVATSDRPALERIRAADGATAVAEYFRDLGLKVLLIVDSLTRVARAYREVGLAAGEPPTRRGFPPSVFSNLPILLERAGNNAKGSIPAFYTILVEGDNDSDDPIADEVRGLLDAHIVLSRQIAAKGIFPAIDVRKSVSRLMTSLANSNHLDIATEFRKMLTSLDEVELLIRVGEYVEGADLEIDKAVQRKSHINGFLSQKLSESAKIDMTLQQLNLIVT